MYLRNFFFVLSWAIEGSEWLRVSWLSLLRVSITIWYETNRVLVGSGLRESFRRHQISLPGYVGLAKTEVSIISLKRSPLCALKNMEEFQNETENVYPISRIVVWCLLVYWVFYRTPVRCLIVGHETYAIKIMFCSIVPRRHKLQWVNVELDHTTHTSHT